MPPDTLLPPLSVGPRSTHENSNLFVAEIKRLLVEIVYVAILSICLHMFMEWSNVLSECCKQMQRSWVISACR